MDEFIYKNEDLTPTEEMEEFFTLRTARHIQNVQRCMKIVADGFMSLKGLHGRMAVHDNSKFSKYEMPGYIWLSWIKKPGNENLEYPKVVNDLTMEAWEHHKLANPHHPEYFMEHHNDVRHMDEVSLAEFVCDIYAMSIEFGGSPREFIDKNITDTQILDEELVLHNIKCKWGFDNLQKSIIDAVLSKLESVIIIKNS